jgi:hypothetical protein
MSKYTEASLRTRTNVNSEYSDDYVYVAESKYLATLGHRGNGLYANRTFYAGDVILEYRGKRLQTIKRNLNVVISSLCLMSKTGKRLYM